MGVATVLPLHAMQFIAEAKRIWPAAGQYTWGVAHFLKCYYFRTGTCPHAVSSAQSLSTCVKRDKQSRFLCRRPHAERFQERQQVLNTNTPGNCLSELALAYQSAKSCIRFVIRSSLMHGRLNSTVAGSRITTLISSKMPTFLCWLCCRATSHGHK
jgi:hypothetical protein